MVVGRAAADLDFHDVADLVLDDGEPDGDAARTRSSSCSAIATSSGSMNGSAGRSGVTVALMPRAHV